LEGDMSQNKGDISKNTAAIEDLLNDVTQNTQDIQDIEQEISNNKYCIHQLQSFIYANLPNLPNSLQNPPIQSGYNVVICNDDYMLL
jgi:hypothetical protein